jgi:hypothetical protein
VYDIIMVVVILGLECERFEESDESLGSTTDRYISDCQIVEEDLTYQRQYVSVYLLTLFLKVVGRVAQSV